MSIDPQEFKKQLLARRDELEQMSEMASESRRAVTLDQQSVGRVSRIDAMQRQEMARAGEQRRLAELSRIKAALKRVELDEYGDCLKCGEEIAPKRLVFDPSVPLCIKCAQGK